MNEKLAVNRMIGVCVIVLGIFSSGLFFSSGAQFNTVGKGLKE